MRCALGGCTSWSDRKHKSLRTFSLCGTSVADLKPIANTASGRGKRSFGQHKTLFSGITRTRPGEAPWIRVRGAGTSLGEALHASSFSRGTTACGLINNCKLSVS